MAITLENVVYKVIKIIEEPIVLLIDTPCYTRFAKYQPVIKNATGTIIDIVL